MDINLNNSRPERKEVETGSQSGKLVIATN